MNAVSFDERTPLYMAAHKGHVKVVYVLSAGGGPAPASAEFDQIRLCSQDFCTSAEYLEIHASCVRHGLAREGFGTMAFFGQIRAAWQSEWFRPRVGRVSTMNDAVVSARCRPDSQCGRNSPKSLVCSAEFGRLQDFGWFRPGGRPLRANLGRLDRRDASTKVWLGPSAL